MIMQQRPQFSLRHAAHMVGVCDRTVRRWIRAGKIDGWQCGGRQSWYVDLADVNKMRNMYGLPSLTTEQAIELHQRY